MKKVSILLVSCLVLTTSCRTHYKNDDTHFQPPCEEDIYARSEWWRSFNDPILDYLVEETVSNNHDIKAALARICESRAAAKAANSNLFPDINVSGTAQKYKFSDNGIVPIPVLEQEGLFKGEPQFFDIGFDVSWEIDLFGVNRNKVIATKEQVCEAIESHYDLLTSLIAEVARNYILLRKDQQILATIQERLNIQRNILRDLEAKKQSGLSSELQVSTSFTREKEIESEMASYEASVQTGIHKISVLTGKPPKALEPLLEEVHPLPTPEAFDPEYTAANVMLQRPDVRASERALKAQTALLKSAKGKMMPNLWMFALYRLQSMKLSDLFKQGSQWWFLGPFINWRLFERYELQANLELENARYMRTCQEYCQQILIAYEDIESSYVDYKQSQKKLQHHLEALESSENTVNLTEKLFGTGLGSYSDFLEAQAAHTIQQENALKVKAQTNIQTIRLHKALGGGWKHFAYRSSTDTSP